MGALEIFFDYYYYIHTYGNIYIVLVLQTHTTPHAQHNVHTLCDMLLFSELAEQNNSQ